MNTTKQSKKQVNKPNLSVSKEAWKLTRKENRGFSIPLFWFAFFTLASLCLAYVDIFTLILTLPFVICPSYFAYLAINSSRKLMPEQTAGFFVMYRTYFTRMFHGSFRVIGGVLKALALGIVSSVVVTSIGESIIFRNDPEFQKLLLSEGSTLEESMRLLEEYVNQNPAFQNWAFIASCITVMVASLVFLRHMSKNSPKLDFCFLRPIPAPLVQFNGVDRIVRKTHKKEFGGNLFKGAWYIDLLVMLSFVGASLIEYYVLKGQNVDHVFVLGLAISLIVILPFMNYLCNLYHVIFNRLANVYNAEFVKSTLEILNKVKADVDITDEDKEKLEHAMNALKEQTDKHEKEEDKEKKDSK